MHSSACLRVSKQRWTVQNFNVTGRPGALNPICDLCIRSVNNLF